MTQPYATLTLLDPRYKHLYFTQEEPGQAIKELSLSRLLDNEASVSSDTVQETGSSDGNSVDELSTEDQSSFFKKKEVIIGCQKCILCCLC